MKSKLLSVLLICFCACQLNAQNVEVGVNENVELMSILAKLSDYREYSMDVAGEYTDEINAYFGEYKKHSATQFMKEIRANYGISYDAVMSMAVHLEKKDGKFGLINESVSSLEKRWESVDKEKFLILLNRFYEESQFESFFTAHKPLYQKGLDIYRENVLKYLNTDWYSSFYGEVPQETFSVIIGFCNGQGNYGASRHLKGEKKEVFAIVGYVVNEDGTPVYTKDYLPTLIHEFNHSFVNYLLDAERFPENVEKMKKAGESLLKSSWWAMANQAYGNWQIVINESVVRAAVICYMLDNGYNKNEIRKEILDQMQRNFRWMPELVVLLREYEKKQNKYQNLENFYPQIISFFAKYSADEEKRFDAVK